MLGAFDDRVDEAAAPDDERSCGLGCGPDETNQDLGIRVIGRSLLDRMFGHKSESSELGSDLGSGLQDLGSGLWALGSGLLGSARAALEQPWHGSQDLVARLW